MPPRDVSIRAMLVASLLLAACRPPGYGQGGGGDDDPPATVDAGPIDDGDLDAPPTDGPLAATCDREFRLEGHGNASTVWLTGSFVDWGGDPANGAIELALGGDGAWTGGYTVDAGSHQYKFIVNGTDWINDPANPDQVDDGFGGTNSVFVCAP